MIDLAKEREAFEDAYNHCDFIKQVNYCGNHYETINRLTINKSTKKLAVSIANSSWSAWQKRAELAQAEITELKQKLDEAHKSRASWVEYKNKVENPEYVLVPRIPNKNMLEAGFVDGDYGCSTLKIYKAMIEAVEKDHE